MILDLNIGKSTKAIRSSLLRGSNFGGYEELDTPYKLLYRTRSSIAVYSPPES